MSSATTSLPGPLPALQKAAIAIGVLGLAACAAGAFMDRQHFFEAYLFGYLFWLGLGAGSLALLMIHHLVGGGWGFSIQRMLESSVMTLPLLAVLFAPLLFGIHDLYHWAHNTPEVLNDHMLQHKAPYLNVPFFIGRAIFYFVVWIGLGTFFARMSLKQDANGDAKITHTLYKVAAPGLILYALTTTFAHIDWVMSLEPHWFSTIFGLIFMISQVLSTFAFCLFLMPMVRHRPDLAPVITTTRLHDLGKLLFACTMLWAYIGLSQFLIIWMGNLPEENYWYLNRSQGGWEVLSVLIVVGQFFIPFFVLLSRHVKKKPKVVMVVALFIMCMRFVDIFWIVRPSKHHASFGMHWLDIAAPLGIGGIWFAGFLFMLARRPLLPKNDPRLEGILHAEH